MDRQFNRNPSKQYESTVAALRALLDVEGVDAVQRAFAQTIYEQRHDRFMRRVDVKLRPDPHVCVSRLLGRPCSDSRESPCWLSIPANDHTAEWLTDSGITDCITTQPYSLSLTSLQQIVTFCETYGLDLMIDVDHSWHFPSRTMLITYRKKTQ